MVKAIVIGVEAYPDISDGAAFNKNVSGAVAEALDFYAWLVEFGAARKKAGAPIEWIEEDEIALHLSPPTGSPPSAHPRAKPATAKAIKDSFKELRQAAGKVQRVFVYFNGHGFSATTSFNGSTTDYIACADFATAEDLTAAIRIDRIKEYLAFMGPCEQYFFFDCCRNVVGAHLEGGTLYNTPPDPTQSKSNQMLLYAARPGQAALPHSPFGGALLAGLRGTGIAKSWRKRELVVDFESVRTFVDERLERLEAEPAEHEGKLFGRLYRIDPVPKYECRIEVDGAPDAPLEARARKHGDETVGPEPVKNGVVALSLAPDYWSVEVTDPTRRYEVEPASAEVDLFDPASVTFVAKPAPPIQLEAAAVGAALGPVELAYPPNTTLEVLDAVGAVASVGDLGGASVRAPLRGGRYLARLRQNDRVIHTQPLTIARGSAHRLRVEPEVQVTPLRSALVRSTGGSTFMPSERLGPIWDGRISLWLASVMAKAAAGRPHPPLQSLLPPPPDGASGALYVAFAGEEAPALTCARGGQSSTIPIAAPPELPGLWVGRMAAPIGPAIVGWSSRAGARAVATCLLPWRVTVLVVADTPAEPRAVQQYFVVPEAMASAVRPDETPADGAIVRSVRALVDAQEAFAREEDLGAAPEIVEPVWLMLTAYAALRRLDLEAARTSAEVLNARFPVLPDSAILSRRLGVAGPPLLGLPLYAEGTAIVRSDDGARAALSAEARALADEAAWGTSYTVWSSSPALSRLGGRG